MSTVPSLAATSQTTTLPATSPTSNSVTDPAVLQQNFLQLLTTQLNNQDPTNPMDNSQLTSQLAQISTVQGIGQLNQSIASLQSAFLQSQTLQGASLIGHSVMLPGTSLPLSGGQGVGGVSVGGAADTVSVSIANGAGQVVRTISLGSSSGGTVNFSWDGKDDKGNQLPDGQYTMSATASLGGKAVTASTLAPQVVAAVTPGSSGLQIDTADGKTIALSSVQEIL